VTVASFLVTAWLKIRPGKCRVRIRVGVRVMVVMGRIRVRVKVRVSSGLPVAGFRLWAGPNFRHSQ